MNSKTLKNIVKEPGVAYTVSANPLDLVTVTRRGMSKQALLNLSNLLGLTLQEFSAVLPITLRTIQRKQADAVFNTPVSEQIVLIAQLTDKGIEVLGNITAFKKWLKQTNTALGGQAPFSLLDTAIGIQLVEDVLGRISHGVYS